MSDTPYEPLASDIVDELLSARADGEFDAAARELGFEPAEAQARLDATPGVREREAALGLARVEYVKVDGLDADARHDMVQRALAEAEPQPADITPLRRPRREHRMRGLLVAGTGIAAAIAIVVALVHGGGSSNKAASSAAAPSTLSSTTVAHAPGEIDTADDLRQFVTSSSRDLSAKQADRIAKAQSSSGYTGTLSNPPAASASGDAGNGSNVEVYTQCEATLAKQLDVSTPALLTKAVRSHGEPAEVVVFAKGNRTLAVLYKPADCAPLISYLSP
jgi:hypothetical protein